MRLAAVLLALLALTGLSPATADGLAPAGPVTQGQCYASGTSGPRVPCVLQGQTWTRVLRPTDPIDAATVGGTAVSAILGSKAPLASPTFSGTVTAPTLAATSGIRVPGNPTLLGVNSVVPGGIDANGFPTGQLGGTYENTTVSHRFFPTTVANGRHFSLTSEMEAGTADPGDKVAAYFSATSGPGNANGASDTWALNTVTRWRPGDPDVNLQGYELDFNNDNVDPGRIPAKFKNGLGIASGGRFQPGFAINIDSTQLYNKWKRGIHIGPAAVSDVGICILCDAVFSGTLIGKQLANGGETVIMQRKTDTSPTGSFMRFVNTANTAQLFAVDVAGRTIIGPSSSGAYLHVSAENPSSGNFSALGLENASRATGINKSVAIDYYGRDTVGTQKPGGSIRSMPADENWVAADIAFFPRSGDALAERLRVTGTGHLLTAGPTPALSACGTSPTIAGNDTAGEVSVGTSATGCTITFAAAWGSKPSCTITAQSGARFAYAISTTALTLTNSDNLSGVTLNYHCLGK